MASRRTVSAKDGAAAVAKLDKEQHATRDTTGMRRCIGSTKFGIEAHEAAATDFPVQPSQKDGLGRMCKRHWNEYTGALRKAAIVRKATEAGLAEAEAEARPGRAERGRAEKALAPEGGAQGDAG